MKVIETLDPPVIAAPQAEQKRKWSRNLISTQQQEVQPISMSSVKIRGKANRSFNPDRRENNEDS